MKDPKNKNHTRGFLGRFWSVTNFDEPDIDSFARNLIKKETIAGIRLMTLLFFCLLIAAAFLNKFVNLGGPPLYAYLLLAVLCLHVLLASFHSQGIDALYLLAIALLMISSTTLVLMAHKSGVFSPTFFTGVALIFIFIPFIPWGLREASLVSFLIYLVITLSVLSSKDHFSTKSIILLQFFMLSIGFIVLALVGKYVDVRRNEILGLFGLQKSHSEMQQLSYKDPLTETWNRRYLHESFFQITSDFTQIGKTYYFVLMDIDNFKDINDTYGHDYGDHILQWTSESFSKKLRQDEYFFRMGGDEFALILGDKPLHRLQEGLAALNTEVATLGAGEHAGVTISIGMTAMQPGEKFDLRKIYKKADKALYAAKRHKGSWVVSTTGEAMLEKKLSQDAAGSVNSASEGRG